MIRTLRFHCRKIQVKVELQNPDEKFIARISTICQPLVRLSQGHMPQHGFRQGVIWGFHLVDNGEMVVMLYFI